MLGDGCFKAFNEYELNVFPDAVDAKHVSRLHQSPNVERKNSAGHAVFVRTIN